MNQEIIQLETKKNHIQTVIDNQKKKLENYQQKLLALAQQINEIKTKTNKKPTWK